MQPIPTLRSQNAIAGVAILLLSLSVLSVLDASGKWILAAGVSLVVVTWFRYVVHFLLIVGLLLSRNELHLFKSHALKYQLSRGVTILFTTMGFFTTISYLPQAQATTMLFAAPLIILALAPWLLGEPKRVSRWLAATLGFMGVLIVVRPSSGLSPIGVGFGVLTALLMATQHLLTRKVAIDHPLTTILWSGMIGAIALTLMLPIMLPIADPHWAQTLAELPLGAWAVLLSLGLSGGIGHLLQVQAYRLAAASLLAPFMYVQIIPAAALGWLIWGDFPDAISWIGIGLICTSGAGIAWYEWHSSRRQAISALAKRPA
ncbi:DMT family transporter [Orrella daihaiensis]|uniref:DMT family transporter n=1 Tax=Orrella daihaiensis TaxID=2782176 RepID=A0ABY4AGD5_9BURK|nr:DMT family transporter [Orrella daihaiensis]UOD49317.1 DMT family transporter [Orrella daihaiensis]